MKVIKFGGSSLANATQIHKVLNIVKADPERRIIVVSAPGKRFPEDKKVTDELIEFARLVLNEMSYEAIQEDILNRYREITLDLNMDPLVMKQIEKNFEKLIRTNFHSNELLIEAFKASGEDNHAKLIAAFLEQEGVSARYISPQDAGVFVTSEPGNATILPESYNFLNRLRDIKEVLVIPGFFGYNEREEIITFSRGGSDITGAIVANGVQADMYENFTDVDAIYVANPHYIPDSKKISHLTYREMRELSYSGFSVFHDEALLPAFSGGIPVWVKNTNNPNAKGTKITRTKPKTDSIISGIASSSGFISIHISKYLMNREVGFIRKVSQIFEDLQLNLDHMPSGIDEINIILKRDQLTPGKQAALLYRLKNELQSDDVHIQANVCLVMLVGEGMVSSVGTTATATQALADAGVNLVMINQGSSEISLMFGIVETDEEKAVKAIYHAFF